MSQQHGYSSPISIYSTSQDYGRSSTPINGEWRELDWSMDESIRSLSQPGQPSSDSSATIPQPESPSPLPAKITKNGLTDDMLLSLIADSRKRANHLHQDLEMLGNAYQHQHKEIMEKLEAEMRLRQLLMNKMGIP